jgi:hypothetical protein
MDIPGPSTEVDAPRLEGDNLCPKGHIAVTLQKRIPVDKVQITLRPAAVIVDPIKNQVIWERHYWLVLADIGNTEELVSENRYLWREALALAEKFQGRSRESAWSLWNNLKP